MKTTFAEQAWVDYMYWQQTDKALLKRINALIEEIKRTPFTGKGKPEALRHHLTGFWSRRINQEHRLVYRVTDDAVMIASCRYHY